MEHEHPDAQGHACYPSATLEVPLNWLDLVLDSPEAPRDMANSCALCNKPETTSSTGRREGSVWNAAPLCPAESNNQGRCDGPGVSAELHDGEDHVCVSFGGLDAVSGLRPL